MLPRLLFVLLLSASACGQVCQAVPLQIGPHEDTAIQCTCDTVSTWAATSGRIVKDGPSSATFTADSPGLVTITPTCTGNAPANTVNVFVTYPPSSTTPATLPLCAMSFTRDTKRPTRVDNEALACADDIALSLQRNINATLVLVGEDIPAHPSQSALRAQQRAVNVKDYLVKQKGIDSARIKLFTDSGKAKQVNAYLVPPGANIPAPVSTPMVPVDESSVKAVVRNTKKSRAIIPR